jgi:hypothetical protein
MYTNTFQKILRAIQNWFEISRSPTKPDHDHDHDKISIDEA